MPIKCACTSSAGEFLINGKTKVVASSLAALLQQWLETPKDVEKALGSGSKLIIHAHWNSAANQHVSVA